MTTIRGVEVSVAPRPLPRANMWAILERSRRWLAFSPSPAGCRVHLNGEIQRARIVFCSSAWHTSVLTQDHLGLDGASIGAQERVITAQLDE